jgi:FHS family L-fucose permease-like MFS transporter
MSMAIVGGAIVPVIQGAIADHIGIHHAYLLPVICYVYILFYALKGSTPNSERYRNGLENARSGRNYAASR